ncbi:CpsB/CapC family capsule biosynthesis tyrosine phosphatase [Cytophagaceae bacterium ABcell3]|nr:CpsB/CapC family capsule biosynthesis tyrosine phosphatase [Cytophagaceae bacterium ABcell3]
MGLFDLFKKSKNNQQDLQPLLVDMHSHLLPGLDDGSESIEESVDMIKELAGLGYKKLICTPHIMGDFYKNTPESIHEKLQLLKNKLVQEQIPIELEAAAEYYLDEWFLDRLSKPETLMTFGGKFLLIETSYLNEPVNLDETIFQIKASGFYPVLAHPERYTYLYSDFSKFKDIFSKEIYFQININSLSGYYSKPAQVYAKKLIENNMVHFAGTDCHGMRHIHALKKTRQSSIYRNLIKLPLLNNGLLSA